MSTEHCPECGAVVRELADSVSIYEMYDNHGFRKLTASTVDETINLWLEQLNQSSRGLSFLCPAIVLNGKKELRRVGQMVFFDYNTKKPKAGELEAYRQALLADPDIQVLLELEAA